jgi:hypothetical protein
MYKACQCGRRGQFNGSNVLMMSTTTESLGVVGFSFREGDPDRDHQLTGPHVDEVFNYPSARVLPLQDSPSVPSARPSSRTYLTFLSARGTEMVPPFIRRCFPLSAARCRHRAWPEPDSVDATIMLAQVTELKEWLMLGIT